MAAAGQQLVHVQLVQQVLYSNTCNVHALHVSIVHVHVLYNCMIFVAIDLHVPVSGTRTATGTRSLVVLWGTTNIFYPTIRTLLPVICVYLAFLGWLEKVGNEGFTIERLMYR